MECFLNVKNLAGASKFIKYGGQNTISELSLIHFLPVYFFTFMVDKDKVRKLGGEFWLTIIIAHLELYLSSVKRAILQIWGLALI